MAGLAALKTFYDPAHIMNPDVLIKAKTKKAQSVTEEALKGKAKL